MMVHPVSFCKIVPKVLLQKNKSIKHLQRDRFLNSHIYSFIYNIDMYPLSFQLVMILNP